MIICENCRKEVMPVKKRFSAVGFILMLISGILTPVAIIYLIIHLCRRNEYCPNCNKKVYKRTLNNKINDKLMEKGNPTLLYTIRAIIVIVCILLAISIIKDYIK
jgi:purine-cytosine permease-like protein